MDDKAGLKQLPFSGGALEGGAQLGHQDMGYFSVIPEGQGCCVLLLVPYPAAKKNPTDKPVFSRKLQELAGVSTAAMRYQKSPDRYFKTYQFGKLLESPLCLFVSFFSSSQILGISQGVISDRNLVYFC